MIGIPPDICADFKLGTTLAGILRLPDLGIPDPYEWTYNEFSVRAIKGTGLASGHGFPIVTWGWPNGLERSAMFALLNFLGTAAGAFVYMRTLDNTWTQFASYYAMMTRPELAGTDGKPAPMLGKAYVPVTLKFTRMVAQ